jgi:hypothetical protein
VVVEQPDVVVAAEFSASADARHLMRRRTERELVVERLGIEQPGKQRPADPEFAVAAN